LPPNSLDNFKRQAVEFDTADVAGLPESGRGLAIILNHMDSVDYFSASGRNTLRMMLNIGGK
jgi:anti-sigma regulatory factor (Ser/Thr protein kinase)